MVDRRELNRGCGMNLAKIVVMVPLVSFVLAMTSPQALADPVDLWLVCVESVDGSGPLNVTSVNIYKGQEAIPLWTDETKSSVVELAEYAEVQWHSFDDNDNYLGLRWRLLTPDEFYLQKTGVDRWEFLDLATTKRSFCNQDHGTGSAGARTVSN